MPIKWASREKNVSIADSIPNFTKFLNTEFIKFVYLSNSRNIIIEKCSNKDNRKVTKEQFLAKMKDKDYIKKNIIEELPTEKVKESLYNYLENDLGIKISYGNKDFKIEPVSDEDVKYIDLNGHNHIAVLRSDIYTEGTDFLHYTESRHRVDKFYFSEFARRKSDRIN